jgi:2-iminoacetate synthase
MSNTSFKALFDQYDWQDVSRSIYAKTASDVVDTLHKDRRNLEDFKALISPAAKPYLEQMAKLSQEITQKRFGKPFSCIFPCICQMSVRIFAPIAASALTTTSNAKP